MLLSEQIQHIMGDVTHVDEKLVDNETHVSTFTVLFSPIIGLHSAEMCQGCVGGASRKYKSFSSYFMIENTFQIKI